MTFDIERHAKTRMKEQTPAPGKPGSAPRWTTGAKTAVGTAVSQQSRIWFTIAHGIVNEIYFPTIDQANLRAARFLVADGRGFFSDEECSPAQGSQICFTFYWTEDQRWEGQNFEVAVG
ncbi:MAG TPA: hypothetical protein VF283_06280 [Bryobacteraceae bacterium]